MTEAPGEIPARVPPRKPVHPLRHEQGTPGWGACCKGSGVLTMHATGRTTWCRRDRQLEIQRDPRGSKGKVDGWATTCWVSDEIDRTQVAVVGGKGAHLGELSRIEGVRVPAGFCVTTDAFRRIMAEAPSIDERLDRLSRLSPDDREAIRTLSAEIRRTLEGIAIPDDLAAAITGAVAPLGEQPPTPSDRARQQRTCRRPPSPASRTPT